MDKERFIEKAKIIFGDAYDYGKVPNEFKSNSSVKVEIICPKHGSFFKSYGNHIIKKQGCPECAKKDKKLKLSNDEFINRLKSIYNSDDYSFDKVNYTGINNNIIITCKKHGDFEISPKSALYKGAKCKQCQDKILSRETFIKKANEVHHNYYDYSKVNFIASKYKVEIICPKHGSFFVSPVLHVNKCVGCAKCHYEKHGRLTIEQFIKIANERYNNFYDYSKVKFVKHSDIIEIICPKHGSFFQSVSSHLNGSKPCPNCRKILTQQSDFIKMANEVHGLKYDYSKVDFKNMQTPVEVICPKHGSFYPSPSNHIHKKSGCPKCATAYNKNENELKDFIKSLGLKIIENDRRILRDKNGFYELDCYIPERKIAIEFDGLYWHSVDKKSSNYHLLKTNKCIDKGIRLIHIFEDEWIFKKKIVKSRIRAILGLTKNKVYARKCEIKQIAYKEANTFITKYHIQGNCQSSVRLGLFYKNRLCAVMTFGKSRFNKKYDWELLRYCTLSNFNIIGGASKLLSYFKKNYGGSIITYADKRWSAGNLYKQLGFTQLKDSPPAYWYFLGKKRYSRTLFQKHLLKNKLDKFYENKTEMENMIENGYSMIYDCGNHVFFTEGACCCHCK